MRKKDDNWWADPEAKASQCNGCVHNNFDYTCKAFPEGIPSKILLNEIIHDKPLKNDNGFQYEKKKPYSDPRWWDNPMGVPSQCNDCVHNHRDLTCEAFPERIPREILSNKFIHDKPYENDNGFRYEKKK